MKPKKEQLQNLLVSTNLLIENQKKIEKLKGETFNIFSILNVETLETKLHTPFLRELLNPNGSHLMGDVFLKLFIEMLSNKGINIANHLQTKNSILKQKDKYLGKINEDLQEGGFIDIFIQDNLEKSISIENKIGAEDQESQLVRYYKHNTNKGILLYLTKFGSVPDDKSIDITNKSGDLKDIDKLEEGNHYHIISYQKDITTWLKNCLKEASEQPILRESIKQYLIIIKKITNTMSKEGEKELENLIINNGDAAIYIFNNYKRVKYELGVKLREKVIVSLKNSLDDYTVERKNINESYTDILITNNKNKNFCFQIESFSYEMELFIGIMKDGKWGSKNYEEILKHENININLSSSKFFKKLNIEEEVGSIVNSITEQTKVYIKSFEENQNK